MPKEIFESTEKPAKKVKKVMSDDQKERLKAQLAKGRATALANRQKRALVNKIDKEDDIKAQNEKIAKSVLGKKLDSSSEVAELRAEMKLMRAEGGDRDEINKLKKHINLLTTSMSAYIKSQNKQKPSVKFQATDTIIEEKPEPVVEPVVEPVKVEPPEKKSYVSRSSRLAGFF